ncbi:carbohydrate ABC transporter permease [Paenibacillus hamazuiensis]|uniref:carbohydrate ABC transporter permease n=1 Tax=Paenibacillus hamazuiensis TaxID=2936508 RepID=UPI00200D6AF3|nr:carbohydrate ABC transporter permease [Paenibacillus hamazuiensis]
MNITPRWFTFVGHSVLMAIALVCVVPYVSLISISLSKQTDLAEFGYALIPRTLDFSAYRLLFANPGEILNAYTVSIGVAVVGTFLSLAVIAMVAYPLSRSDYRWRSPMAFYLFFTMLFHGGLVPWYILIKKLLQLGDTFWVLILPYLANVWFIFLMRTFMQQIPSSLIEAAKIDGASEFRVFAGIILPLCKPALTTVGLFILLQYWNDWWLAMLFIDNEKLVPLQYLLARMMNNVMFLSSGISTMPSGIEAGQLPTESLRMAMTVVAVGPMVLIFPFFQKHFVRGLTVGAVKG